MEFAEVLEDGLDVLTSGSFDVRPKTRRLLIYSALAAKCPVIAFRFSRNVRGCP